MNPAGASARCSGWKPGEDETGGWCIARVAGEAEVDAARAADRARTDAARRTRRRIAAGRGRRSICDEEQVVDSVTTTLTFVTTERRLSDG
jgi:hypothetical protein